MKNSLLKYIAAHDAVFGAGSRADNLEAILLTRRGRLPGQQRIHWFVFQRGSPHPLLVARHYASPGCNAILDNEYGVLSQLWRQTMLPVAPQPLALTEIHGFRVMVERFCAGQSMAKEIKRAIWNGPMSEGELLTIVRNHLDIAQTLIMRLDSIGRPETVTHLERELTEIYKRCRIGVWADRGLTVQCEDFFQRLVRLACEAPVRIRIFHNDLTPDHLICTIGDARLIDWEVCDESTLGFLEPYVFVYGYLTELSYLGIASLSMDPIANFERYIQGELGELGQVFDGFLERCRQSQQEPATFRAYWFAFILLLGSGWLGSYSDWSPFLPSPMYTLSLQRLLRTVTAEV